MDRLLRLGGGMPLNQGPPPSDAPVVDTAEQVSIIKMLLIFISFILFHFLFFSFFHSFFIFKGVHIVVSSFKNA